MVWLRGEWICKNCVEGEVEDTLGTSCCTVLHGQANREVDGRNCGKWHEMEDKKKVVVMVVDKACKKLLAWATKSGGELTQKAICLTGCKLDPEYQQTAECLLYEHNTHP